MPAPLVRQAISFPNVGMQIQDQRVLISGATGFIGGNLARRLLTREAVRVRALVRDVDKASWLRSLGAELFRGDIRDAVTVKEATADCQIVYHCAAWADEQGHKADVMAVNRQGTQHMVDAAITYGVSRFIHLSSCAVYGSLQQMDIDESTPLRRSGRVYHDSKIEAEELVRAASLHQSLPIVIARPSQVYGPGSPQFTLRVLEAVQKGHVILVDGGRHFMKPVYIDNLIDGLVLCAGVDAAVGQAFNLSDGFVLPWRDYFEAFRQMTGAAPFPSVPYAIAWMYGLYKEIESSLRNQRSSMNRDMAKTFRSRNSFSNAKAQQLLGWEPRVDWPEGIRATEQWLRKRLSIQLN